MTIKTIDSTTLKEWLKNDEAILVDVREPAEHKTENIPNAKSIPLSKICNLEADKILSGNKKIVFHCLGGKRSATACETILGKIPNAEIYSLEGGINAWKSCGLETCLGSRKVIPLDRQVQISAGLISFLGVILGFLIDKNFFLISGFVSLGLIFAGITGLCGMARILALMPWNK
ncbi:MAG: rhodanese-like domain-containing protein [Rickettsiales bacterium]|nr:rhodanese-like domain-containing protein [Rickettsiales bacterium]